VRNGRGVKARGALRAAKRMEMVGPIGERPLEDHTLDQDVAARLWTLSEQKTSLSWSL